MTDRSRAATALTAALLLGLGADLLLRTTPWGLNAFIWILGLAAAASLTTRASPLDAGLAAPLLFFAGMIAWSDAPMVTALNVLAAVGLMALPLVEMADRALSRVRTRDLLRAGHRIAGNALTVPNLVAESGVLARASGVRFTSLALGAVITVPVSAVFISLFGQADPNFEALAARVWSIQLVSSGVNHIAFAVLFALPAAAYLRALVRPAPGSSLSLPSPRLGLSAVVLPLGATILIFATYLVLQAGYLFGGAEFLANTPGLTTATYARRGFFELVAAATFVVPLLVGAQWLLGPARRYHRPFAALSTSLICLVVGVVGSALHRMLLYWRSFGLSQDRVYASVFMGWIAFVLVWFAWTVLAHRGRGFLYGAALAGLVALGGVNLVNVDGLVVRVNVARAAAGKDVDVEYHARSLSADGVPVLAARLDRLDPETRCALVRQVADRWQTAERDWRSWNVSRWRAIKAVSSRDFRTLQDRCAAALPLPSREAEPGPPVAAPA